jgi:hypothetical protein
VRLVLDASVALKWFFMSRPEERDADVAGELLKAYAAGRQKCSPHPISRPERAPFWPVKRERLAVPGDVTPSRHDRRSALEP